MNLDKRIEPGRVSASSRFDTLRSPPTLGQRLVGRCVVKGGGGLT